MKPEFKKIKIIILLLLSLKAYSQIIEEGRGYNSILLGTKYNTIIKLLGNDFVEHKVDKNDEFYFDYTKIGVIVNFDNDSISNEITLKPSINKLTSKGLLIKKGLTVYDVEKVYGDDWWTTEESGDLGFDCGIRFNAKDSIITKIFIEESDLDNKDYSFYEYIEGIYIPKNINDCFNQIDSFWDDATKSKVKNWTEDEFSSNTHFGFGMWMRNNWRLWGGSRLSKHFNELGIYHPDDMSGIILDSYHRYLTGQDIKLDKQIEYYQAYWKVNKVPAKEDYPKGVKKLEFNTTMRYKFMENNYPGTIHIQTNSKIDKIWIYDYHFGWLQISNQELKELENLNKREETLKRLFNKK